MGFGGLGKHTPTHARPRFQLHQPRRVFGVFFGVAFYEPPRH